MNSGRYVLHFKSLKSYVMEIHTYKMEKSFKLFNHILTLCLFPGINQIWKHHPILVAQEPEELGA